MVSAFQGSTVVASTSTASQDGYQILQGHSVDLVFPQNYCSSPNRNSKDRAQSLHSTLIEPALKKTHKNGSTSLATIA